MNTKNIARFVIAASAFAPAIAFAATGSTLKDLIYTIITYLNYALVLMMAVAVVMFTYYVVKYYVMPNENRSEGNMYVLYSVIGFFVILSFWGLVNIVQNSFGLSNTSNRPSDWASFTTIFPGASSGSSANTRAGDPGTNAANDLFNYQTGQ